jgi:hypothetical protein
MLQKSCLYSSTFSSSLAHTNRVKNFLQYSSLYPEYKCVFIGDNGQGTLTGDRKEKEQGG